MDDWEGLDEAFEALEAECEQIVRGLTVRIWNGILSKTPQYHGRMVASWSYSLNGPEYVDRSEQVEFMGPRKIELGNFEPSSALYKGHHKAINVANLANTGREMRFKLGDTVYISNGVDHGEGPYSELVENGGVHLRAPNLPGAPVARTLDWVEANFGVDIKPYRAEALKGLKIGSQDAD